MDRASGQARRTPTRWGPSAAGWMGGLFIAAAGVTTQGCVREANDFVCPVFDTGALVITEIRGPQAGTDDQGQWIELHNASSESVDLRGMRLRMFRRDGSGEAEIVVRAGEDQVTVDPGGYVVLGHHPRDKVPTFVDYTFIDDYSIAIANSCEDPCVARCEGLCTLEDQADCARACDLLCEEECLDVPDELQARDLPDSAVIEVEACGEIVDRMFYEALPTAGSWALDGQQSPDANNNDQDEAWCDDPTSDNVIPGAMNLGTPKQANPSCP